MHLARDAPPLVFLRKDEPGQPFRACLLGALPFRQLFGRLPRRQVEVGADDAHDRAARIPSHWKAAREDVDVLPLLVAKPELSFVDLRATGEALVEALRQLHVVWMDQAFPGTDVRLDLVGLVAEHVDPARRVEHRSGLEVPVPDAFLRAGEREPQPFLALAQRRLRQFPLGQIEVGADDADDGSAGPAPDRIPAGEHMDVVAILVAEPELGFERRLTARDAVLRLFGAPPIVGMDEPLELADVRLDLVVVVAEHLFPARRVEDVPGEEIEVPHALARAGNGQRQPLLALAQLGFGAPPGGDVAQHQQHLVAIDGSNGDLDKNFGRPGKCEARIDPDVCCAGSGLIEPLADGAARLRREQVEGGGAEKPVRRFHGAQPQRRWVGELDTVLTADEDAVR